MKISNLSNFPDQMTNMDILTVLQSRYEEENYFTLLNDKITLITNPFLDSPKQMYSNELLTEYSENKLDIIEDKSHLFYSIVSSYYQTINHLKNKIYILRGSVSSGKSTTYERIIKSIIRISKSKATKISHDNIDIKIKQALLVFQYLGMANTQKGNGISLNAMRTNLYINPRSKGLIGAEIIFHLLHMERLYDIDSYSERDSNFIIFYSLLGGNENLLNSLHLQKDYTIYSYLNSRNPPNIKNTYTFNSINDAFSYFAFSQSEIDIIYRILASILHLGNLTFVIGGKGSKEDGSPVIIQNEEKELVYISDLLQVKRDSIKSLLLFKNKVINGSSIIKSYSIGEAISIRDTIACVLYTKLFDWIFMKINQSMMSKVNGTITKKTNITIIEKEQYPYIGIIDIPGFKPKAPDPKSDNTLIYLCSNYLIEKINKIFIFEFFKSRVNDLNYEGLGNFANNIIFKDNSSILDIFDNESIGLFALLSHACESSIPENEFLSELYESLTLNNNISFPPSLIHPKSTRRFSGIAQSSTSMTIARAFSNFIIHHSDGAVKYSTSGLITQNYNEVPQTVYDVFLSTSQKEIQMILLGTINENEMILKKEQLYDEYIMANGNPRRGYYITNIIKEKSKAIFQDVNVDKKNDNVDLHFIVCIKSNSKCEKKGWYPREVYNQIISFDFISFVNSSRDAYQVKLEFAEFNKIFQILLEKRDEELSLLKEKNEDFYTDKNKAVFILESLTKSTVSNLTSQCLLGNDNIFLQTNFLKFLMEKKDEQLANTKKSAQLVAGYLLAYKQQYLFRSMQRLALKIQRNFRRIKEMVAERLYLEQLRKIQCRWRKFASVRKLKKLKVCSIKVQAAIRRFLARMRFIKLKQFAELLYPKLIWFLYYKKKKEKMRIQKFVYTIIHKAFDKIILKQQTIAITLLNSYFRMMIFRKNNQGLIKKIKQMNLRRWITRAALKIQTFYRGQKMFIKFHIMKFCTDYIRSKWKMKKVSLWYQNLRIRALKIQRSVKKFLNKKKAFEHRLYVYFEQNFSKKLREEYNRIKKYFSNDKKQNTQKEYVNTIEKIFFFIQLYDIDLYNSTNNIYNGDFWIDIYQVVEKYNKNSNSPILSINLGECHTVLLNSKGKIFSFGWNDQSQSLNNELKSTNIIIQSVVKDDATFLLTKKGVIISNSNIKVPVNIHFSSIFPSCNEKDCFAIQNGQNASNASLYIIKLNDVDNSNNNKSQSEHSHNVSIKQVNLKISVEYISSGKNFSMLLSKEGILYSMGSKNVKGELGLGDYFPRTSPTMIKVFVDNGVKIISVKCGFKHVICLGSNRKVYSWGSNSHGQLGLDKYGNFPNPMWIKFDDFGYKEVKVNQIATGFKASYFLTDNREFLFCGMSGINFKQSSRVKKMSLIRGDISKDSYPVKLNCSWNLSLSILYVTYADMSNIKKNTNFTALKIKWMLDNIALKWRNDNTYEPPYIKGVSEYI